jgi:GTP-binding protein
MIRPIVALVGRPNVGKSTLFNRLIGRRQAIVRDVPGVTRDRLYGPVVFERWQATAVDTGGLDPSSEEPLVESIRRQVMVAVEEADVVVFVVDARDGATGLDLEVARILRRAGRSSSPRTRSRAGAARKPPPPTSSAWDSASPPRSPPSTAAVSPSCSK